MTIDPVPHSRWGREIQISREIVRFALVGGAATLTHMGVAGLLISAGVLWPTWMVNVVAFAVAFWISFFGHRLFTFQRAGNPLRFVGAALAGLAVNYACLAAALWATGHDMFSIALAAMAAPAVVFVISRLWVFND